MGILKWFEIGFATSTQNIFYFCQNRPSTKPLSKLCKYVCRDSLQKRLPIFPPKPLKYENHLTVDTSCIPVGIFG